MNRNTVRSLPFYFSARFFLLFLAASVVLVAAYTLYPGRLYVALVLDGVLILAAIADFLIGPSPRDMRLERHVLYPLAVDNPNEIPLEISNRTGRAVSIVIQDDIPDKCNAYSLPLSVNVGAGELVKRTYKLQPNERGDAEFGNIHFWLPGPMGLTWKHGASEGRHKVKCYPGLAMMDKGRMAPYRLTAQDMVRSVRQKGEGTEFDSLRDYIVGDDARLIHWSTSARKGKPMVRQNRIQRSQTIFLVLDTGRMMTARVLGKTKFDYGLNAALLLTRSALELGDNVGVTAIAREILCFLPPSKGPRHFGRILDATYALEPQLEEPRFYLALSDVSRKLRTRSLVVIFTDLIDERASLGLIRYNLGLVPRHLPLVVVMSDNEVVRVADAFPAQERDLYRQGVAAEVLNRREQLLAKLRSSGVMVIDTEPDKISSALLDRYLDIKARNIL
ncbi:MAG TPA: DUF58 domain-containing protein [Desulfomonilaceae bacterium]|nr:DUF58 domain-containing protein [Desulfomonilaceae bacterium]